MCDKPIGKSRWEQFWQELNRKNKKNNCLMKFLREEMCSLAARLKVVGRSGTRSVSRSAQERGEESALVSDDVERAQAASGESHNTRMRRDYCSVSHTQRA